MVGIHGPRACYRLGIAKKGDCCGGTHSSSTTSCNYFDTS